MRVSVTRILLFVVPGANVLAQTPALQMGTVYECPAVQATMQVYSCAGPAAGDWCDVQTTPHGRPAMRGKSTRQQVMTLLRICHVQTPAEAQGAARGAAAPSPAGAQAGAGPGGFKVGDRVRILTNGWQEARVLEVRGTFYFVQLDNGIQVSKQWPTEVRRIGKLTAADHAAGQYDAHERVQVYIAGRWAEGEIMGQQGNMYEIKVPGYHGDFDTDMYSTTPENIRLSTTPAAPPPAQRAAGQPPKPGLTSCGGKFDGRWELSTGTGGLRIVFRAGRATVTEVLSPVVQADCFMGGGQVLLYKTGTSDLWDEPIYINKDGTLQTSDGAIKRMGD
jgi:hypothetical protein